MTENEAKEWIEYLGNKNLPYDRSPISRKLACDIAIQALEEIQQYRAIGTVERLLQLQHDYWYLNEMCKEYSAIGTIDEFKALKEKSVAKKPLFSTVNRDTAYHCGSCKKFVGFYDTRKYEYCHNCGTKIDWSE